MKKILLVVAAVLSLSFVSPHVAYAATDFQVGVINLQGMIGQLPQMQKISDKLKSQFAARQAEVTKGQDEFKKMAEDYRKNSAVMAEKDKNVAQDKLIKKEQEVQRKQMELQRDFVEAQNKEVNVLLTEIKAVVAEVAQKRNLSLVLVDAGVAYSSKKMDVTSEVLEAMKKKK